MMLGKRGQKYEQADLSQDRNAASTTGDSSNRLCKLQAGHRADSALHGPATAKIAHADQISGGDHDAILDTARTAERLRKLTPQAEIHVLNDTGHLIIDQFDVVHDFL